MNASVAKIMIVRMWIAGEGHQNLIYCLSILTFVLSGTCDSISYLFSAFTLFLDSRIFFVISEVLQYGAIQTKIACLAICSFKRIVCETAEDLFFWQLRATSSRIGSRGWGDVIS